MSNNNKTPAIRFKGFTDTWEQRKLGDMMNVTSVKRIHQSDWTSSGVRFLRARDIVALYKNEEPSDYLYISEEKYNEYSSLSGKVKVGDLLVTGVGTIGVPMLINDGNPLYFKDGNVIWFQNENKINGDFFYYSFIGNAIQSFIQESAGTGTVGTYTIDSGKKTPISLPTNESEQQKIGNYFRNLDHLITLHQRKYDKLTKVKKAMLKKMFPQNGANKPEIRFRGFTDGWEHCKLNSIADVRDGTHASPQYFSSGHPFITSKNVKDGYINYDDVQYISDEDYEEINKRSKVDVNDILMGMIGTIGNLALIREEPDFAIKNVALIKDTGDIFYLYLYHYLQSETVLNQLLENMDGGTQKFVALKRIRELNIAFPIKSEQQAIGTYFHNLDSVITLHQRKCDKYKSIKAGLIRKFFP